MIAAICGALVASILLAACGGGSESGSTTTPLSPEEAAVAKLDTCSLLSSRDLRGALGSDAPQGHHIHRTKSECEYSSGPRTLIVSVEYLPTKLRHGFGRPPFPPHEFAVKMNGAKATARTYIKPGPAGTQVRVNVVKGPASAHIVLTDSSLRKGTLIPTVIALGRAMSAQL